MRFTVLSAAVALLSAQNVLGQITVTPTAPSNAQASQFGSDLGSFVVSLVGDPKATSFANFVQTASIDFSGVIGAGQGGLDSLSNVQVSALPSYISQFNSLVTGTIPHQDAWPTEQVSFIKSVYAAEASIFNKDLDPKNSAAPSGRAVQSRYVALVGGALAAGLAVMLAL